jgi:type IV pilus assembly protein PilA
VKMRSAPLSLVLLLWGCNLVKGPPRDHECRARLRTIIGLENAHFAESQRYSVHPVEIGFAPPQGNRYLYVFDPAGPLTRRDELPSPPLAESVGYGPDTKRHGVLLEDLLTKLPPDLRGTLGLEGSCPDCNVTIACVGNVDQDPDVDVWTISTKDRPEAARGTPIHHLKDLP